MLVAAVSRWLVTLRGRPGCFLDAVVFELGPSVDFGARAGRVALAGVFLTVFLVLAMVGLPFVGLDVELLEVSLSVTANLHEGGEGEGRVRYQLLLEHYI